MVKTCREGSKALRSFGRCLVVGVWSLVIQVTHAQMTDLDELRNATYPNGEAIPYLLTTRNLQTPTMAFIIQPGGSGSMYLWGNFLIRSRSLLADEHTLVVTTDATSSPERLQAILKDLEGTYPGLKVFLIGTSNGTFSTMRLGQIMDGQLEGFIHTSSLSGIASFDSRTFKSRHLMVHHEDDGCRYTPYASAQGNHEKYGTDFISVRGGVSVGDPCLAYSHHGYRGIEKEVVEKIKAWAMLSKTHP
jgi:hypothetical protein